MEERVKNSDLEGKTEKRSKSKTEVSKRNNEEGQESKERGRRSNE